ncbi:MAG: carboxypeptidase regulatory-like domain-containing protein, partial [Planctomycetes bacterium]|nr:carboxypeptidase regulatory-like domain-containing protein [Planctomycetota bacterium]
MSALALGCLFAAGAWAGTASPPVVAKSIVTSAQGSEWPAWIPRALIQGQVVDEAQQPLGDVDVFLVTDEDVWCNGWCAPSIEVGNWSARGWSVKSQADGYYYFSVPIPEVRNLYLCVRGSEHNAVEKRSFGLAPEADLLPLSPGGNRIPTIELPAAGAITGVVVDELGAPVVGATLRSTMDWKRWPFGLAQTDAAGRYTLGHLPPRKIQVWVESTGYIASREPDRSTIEAGRTIAGPDFELRRALRLAGVVVDTLGRPVPDLVIQCHSFDRGSLHEVRTDGRGSFQFLVDPDERYTLSLEHESSHRPARMYDDWSFEAGDEQIRLVVEVVPRMDVRVVADSDGAPVERFRIWTGWNNTVNNTEERIPLHVGGMERVDAEIAESEGLWVEAPGFAPFFGTIEGLDRGADGVPTIRLEVGATISGRVVVDGEPVAKARVVIDLAASEARRSLLVGSPLDQFSTERPALRRRAWRGIERWTKRDGRFEFEGLAEGAYRIGIYADGSAPFESDDVRVETGGKVELGDQ